ncbi:hypothetical protein [Sphingomonas sp. KR3-1]|uniref:hypothetical protein n=1 Tax=Sphingomonas sp. KR3-1 TaxID=3156611 RepID=UPI0032B33B4F
MKLCLIALCGLALAGCKPDNSKAAAEIVDHRWAKALSDCGTNHVEFLPAQINYVVNGKPDEPLPIRRLDTWSSDPGAVMFVVKVSKELAAKVGTPDDTSDAAFVFEIQNGRLNLVGEGGPDSILPVKPGDAGYKRYGLLRCPD